MSKRTRIQAKMRSKHDGRKIKALQQRAAGAKGARVKIGLPKDANAYPDGTSVVAVGVYHEFGTSVHAEQSFLRAGIKKGIPRYKRLNRANLIAVLAGEKTAEEAMGELGLLAEGDVVAMIDKLPLVDTGHLKQSIIHQVVT